MAQATKVITGKVRFSYMNVFKAAHFGDSGDDKFSVSLIIRKDDKKTLDKIKAAVNTAIEDGISSKWNGKKPNGLKLPLRDGDTDREDDPAYAGCYFINANSTQRPGIVDRDLQEIIDPNELKSGDYGRASINFYPFNVNGNRGVGVGLNNLQKLADGPALGSAKASAEDDFGGEDFEDDEGLNDF